MAKRRELWHGVVYGAPGGEETRLLEVELIVERQPDGGYVAVGQRVEAPAGEETRMRCAQELADGVDRRLIWL